MGNQGKVLIWDLPTRIFHWSLAGCFAGAWITHELEASGFWLHTIFGYTALVLVLWRVSWGFFGSRHARFSSFMTSPGKAMKYLRAAPTLVNTETPGHNPAGGWAIIVMLALIGVQAGSGLFNGGELLMEGPWYQAVPGWARDLAHEFHEINFNLLLTMVGLHLAAMLFYAVRLKRNLVPAMITGYSKTGNETAAIDSHRLVLALALLALAALVVWTLVNMAPPPSADPLDMF